MSTSPRAQRTCKDVRVVVVDDAEAFRHALAENLRDDGHPVGEHGDPRDVGSLDGVDVLITDFEMRSMDGVAYADLAHTEWPRIAIVLITAYWTVELENALAVRPFVRLWRKPVDYDLVHAELHAWIEAASG